MKKETKLTKTGIVYILTNKMKTESFEFDIPQKHGNWRYEDKKAFLYLNIILIYGPYGKELKKIMGQHDGTINLNEKERIAEPNDINGLILEISFTKMDMKSVFCFFFS